MTEQKELSSDLNLLSRFKFYDNILFKLLPKMPEKAEVEFFLSSFKVPLPPM